MDAIDVLCIGHASYDLTMLVDHHPEPDEKVCASTCRMCGGGPAANAAVTVRRLGARSAFCGYLGLDVFGDLHLSELEAEGVNTRFIFRGPVPTPVSSIVVKPDGSRSLVNWKAEKSASPIDLDPFTNLHPAVVLVDGHEPEISVRVVEAARERGIPTILDAGSVHQGTTLLCSRVDYLVASQLFARTYSAESDSQRALAALLKVAPDVIITLGSTGLIFGGTHGSGKRDAFIVNAIDTTGAGDVFHGAFACGLSQHMEWNDLLRFASAAAALSCRQSGARTSIPIRPDVEQFLRNVPG